MNYRTYRTIRNCIILAILASLYAHYIALHREMLTPATIGSQIARK